MISQAGCFIRRTTSRKWPFATPRRRSTPTGTFYPSLVSVPRSRWYSRRIVSTLQNEVSFIIESEILVVSYEIPSSFARFKNFLEDRLFSMLLSVNQYDIVFKFLFYVCKELTFVLSINISTFIFSFLYYTII